MNPFSQGLLEAGPFLLATVIGALIPSGRSKLERMVVGLVAGLSVVFLQGMGLEDGPAFVSGERAEQWPHLLSAIIFTPMLGAVILMFLPRKAPGFLKGFTLSVMAFDFVISLTLLGASMSRGWHYQYIADWIPSLGIRYHLALDGLSFWMVLLSTFTMPIATIVAFGSIQKRIKDLCIALLMLQGAMIGCFVALDLFLFFVFWEVMLLPMLILIGVYGGVERIKAAYKFFLYTMAGSMMMLAAILYMVWTHQELTGYITFDYLALSKVMLPETAAWICFAAFSLAFFIKVPLFPFHTWLPDAHVQAPTGGSVILAAILLKLGVYGYIRFSMGLFGGPAGLAGPFLASMVILFGIVYGALIAWKQDDVKRLVAYSSVAHMGFVMLGVFAANGAGMKGAILQMINHGVSSGALFLLVGVIYDRRHTRMVKDFGGLAKVMPIYAVIFITVTMSSIGVPGTNGFVGEFMIIMGTFMSSHLGNFSHLQGTLAALGVILAAVYMLSVVQKMFFGPLNNPKNQGLSDMNVREIIAVSPMIAMIFVIGFFPKIFLNPMEPAVDVVLDRYVQHRNEFENQRSGAPARLLSRRGGPVEAGYPEAPQSGEPTEIEEPVAVAVLDDAPQVEPPDTRSKEERARARAEARAVRAARPRGNKQAPAVQNEVKK